LQNAIISTDYDAAPLGALFKELQVRMRMNFIEAQIVYEKRDHNRPAHLLAAMGAPEPIGLHRVCLHALPMDVTRAMYSNSADQG
jgi:hypothetical protein